MELIIVALATGLIFVPMYANYFNKVYVGICDTEQAGTWSFLVSIISYPAIALMSVGHFLLALILGWRIRRILKMTAFVSVIMFTLFTIGYNSL
ncbi:hypothetical protein [Paraferrimonas sp. SM1919]|uniref:hypothetical protein n=1 Tax=Paraferrimonas sp. SM1919 TaxID=2662263 RepID=UPI0013D5B6E6|nr:hypothetical protein [Paraferrimonas sp. SM1919]